MNIRYGNSDSGYRGNPLILLFDPGKRWLTGEAHRHIVEKEMQQRYGPKLRDVKRPPRLPRRKSGGIIGAIMAFIRKRRESKNLEVKEEEKPDLSGPFRKP